MIDDAGASIRKCKCPSPSATGELAGASFQFATDTSTLTLEPFTIAPSAGDTIFIVGGAAGPPQAVSASARQNSTAARIGVFINRRSTTYLLNSVQMVYDKVCFVLHGNRPFGDPC